jgi:hypothetical protein
MKNTALLLVLLVLCMVGLPLKSVGQEAPSDAVYLIFDASGSMWGELPDKSRKVVVAKQVLQDFVAGDFAGRDLSTACVRPPPRG